MNNSEEISFLIGKKLKELRLNSGFKSYEQFAYEKKLSRIQYWKMENGNNFTMKSLLKILDAHSLTFKDFMEDFFQNNFEKTNQASYLETIILASGLNKKEFALTIGHKSTNIINNILFTQDEISLQLATDINKVYPQFSVKSMTSLSQ